jgi:hypothetical protein
VLTVGNDAAGVGRMLAEGELECPSCGGRLSRWGYAGERVFFGPGRSGRGARPRRSRPRRSRCVSCLVRHVLLPARLLARRAGEAVVTGAALAAAGRGYRAAAVQFGVPADTVRGWVRRASGRAGRVRAAFTWVAGALSPDPVPLEPAGSQLADALVAVAVTAAAAASRWPRLLAVSPWQVAAAVTGGSLLLPVLTARPLSTSSL